MAWQCLQVWYVTIVFLVEAVVKDVNIQMNNHLVQFLEIDYGLELGGKIIVDLQNRQPANDTYIMILNHGQWLLWRETDMVTLASDLPQPQATKPLNAFLVSCWRGVLSDRLQGNFLVEESTGGRNRYTVLLVSALKSAVDVHGQIKFENPGDAQLPVQDLDVPWALGIAGGVFL